MVRETTLDAFTGESDSDDSSEEDAAPGSTSEADTGSGTEVAAGSANEADAGSGSEAAAGSASEANDPPASEAADGPDTDSSSGEPSGDSRESGAISSTMVYRPDGSTCPECGRTVTRLWRDGEALVCPSCTSWNRP